LLNRQPNSSAYPKKNKVESLAQLDKLEKNDRDTNKDKQLAFAVFAAITPHRQPTPQNGLRHFSALPTHHPKQVLQDKGNGKTHKVFQLHNCRKNCIFAFCQTK